jgi:hypothetical protein
MRDGRKATCAVVVLGCSLAVLGCVGLAGPAFSGRGPLETRAELQVPIPRTAPDLRIPADVVAASFQNSGDVPLVPLPPVPLAGDARPAAPVIPTSNTPAAPPVAAAETSPPPTNPVPPVIATATPVSGNPLRRLQQQAAARYAAMDSYIARLTRREQVNGKDHPEEVLLFKFRKQPWSIYFKWLGTEGQGREVLYVQGQHENKIHTLLAAGDIPLMPGGKRMAFAVDSPLVQSASRHPITEAGIGASIERLGALLDAQERGDRKRGTLTYLGPQNRPECPRPLDMVEQVIPAGAEKALPRGGKRLYGFDPESQLPVLVTTHDDQGAEVEYYRYDRLQFPVLLDADDFDPDKLWKKAERPARGNP